MDERRGVATKSSSEECPGVQRALESLVTSSTSLAAISAKQTERERTIQTLCNSVWTVVQQQYSVSGKCGEQQQYTVNHQYTQQVATVDAEKLSALKSQMATHLEFSTSELASALFEHSVCELQLLSVWHKQVLNPERKLAPSAIWGLMKTLLSRLHCEAPRSRHKVTAHTAAAHSSLGLPPRTGRARRWLLPPH